MTEPDPRGTNLGGAAGGDGSAGGVDSVVDVLVRAEANLFLAIKRSSGDIFLVVTAGGVVPVVVPSAAAAASVGADVVVEVVVVVAAVVDALKFGVDRPKMGILGRAALVVAAWVVGAVVVVVVVVEEVVVTSGLDSEGLSTSSPSAAALLEDSPSSATWL